MRLAQEGIRALRELGLRTALDLREPVERREDPLDFEQLDLDLRSVPLLAGEVDARTLRGLPELYRDILDSCGERFAAAVRVLAEPGPFRAELVARAERAGIDEQALAVKLGTPPELILQILADTRAHHGGAARYLVDHGLSAADLETLRDRLLTDGGGWDPATDRR